MKTVAVFGSTGSIGVQTLNVVRRFPHAYKVVALAAGNNTALLAEQEAEFSPDYISTTAAYNSISARVFTGTDGAEKLAEEVDADIFVMAISGLAALSPLFKIIKKGKRVALANKEAIVCAGDIVTDEAKRYGTEIIPVDSEHSAVFQCLREERKNVKKVVLTASGGPFYACHSMDLRQITPEMAIKHPTWNMGRKISVDSATMVNKGLEIIEAARLFGTSNVDYIIHPESIIHSMVEFNDNSTLALMSYPNMELAIQYALTYPEREKNDGVKPFDFKKNLTFVLPDEIRFPAPKIAKECLRLGGTAPAIYSIADEVGVGLFLSKKIKFTDICGIIEEALSINEIERDFSIERLKELDREISQYFRRSMD